MRACWDIRDSLLYNHMRRHVKVNTLLKNMNLVLQHVFFQLGPILDLSRVHDLSMSYRHIMEDSSSAEFNPNKTKLLIIPSGSSPGQDLVISLDNSHISPLATLAHLGVTMDNKMSISLHIDNVTPLCHFLSEQNEKYSAIFFTEM